MIFDIPTLNSLYIFHSPSLVSAIHRDSRFLILSGQRENQQMDGTSTYVATRCEEPRYMIGSRYSRVRLQNGLVDGDFFASVFHDAV